MLLVKLMMYFKAITFPPHTVFLLCSAYVGNSDATFLMLRMDEKAEGYTTRKFHKAQAIKFRN